MNPLIKHFQECIRDVMYAAATQDKAKEGIDDILCRPTFDRLSPREKQLVMWWLAGFEEAVVMYRNWVGLNYERM